MHYTNVYYYGQYKGLNNMILIVTYIIIYCK